MAERVLSKSNTKPVSKYKTELANLYSEIDQLARVMDVDRTEGANIETNIRAIRAETDVLKASSAANLATLSQQLINLAKAS